MLKSIRATENANLSHHKKNIMVNTQHINMPTLSTTTKNQLKNIDD